MEFFEQIKSLIIDWGVKKEYIRILAIISYFFIFSLAGFISMWIFDIIAVKGIRKLANESKSYWLQILVRRKVINPLKLLIPLGVFTIAIIPFSKDYPIAYEFATRMLDIIALGICTISIYRFNNSMQNMFAEENSYRKVVLHSLAQLINVFWFISAILLGLSLFFKVELSVVFGYLGAATAILVLIFKDTILGFVSSIQVASSRTLKAGDWVEIPQYGADGELMQINLITSTIKNWDKTVISVPTYALVSSGVKNWDGMVQSGVRRIKRAISLNVMSFKPLRKQDLQKYSKLPYMEEFLRDKNFSYIENIDIYGENAIDIYLDKDRITNLWLFRNYILMYLKYHPHIDNDSVMMVRIEPGTSEGCPLEIYAFSNIIEWIPYEHLQSDILAHLYSMCNSFDILVYQRVSQKFENLIIPDGIQ